MRVCRTIPSAGGRYIASAIFQPGELAAPVTLLVM